MEYRSSLAAKNKLKIVFLGDKAVGKSSIINRFATNRFQEHTQATIGVDFVTKHCKFKENKYKLELWDTAGQEKYRSLIKGYIRGANACVFVYDMTNPQTYRNLVDWLRTFEEIGKKDKTLMVCFGNKSDLCSDNPELEKAKSEVEQITHLQGSAKLGLNIVPIFEEILQKAQESGGKAGQKLQKRVSGGGGCCQL